MLLSARVCARACVKESVCAYCCALSKIGAQDWALQMKTLRLSTVFRSCLFFRSVSRSRGSWGTLYQCWAAFHPHLWFLCWPFVWRNVKRTNTDRDKHRGMVRDGGFAGKSARYPLIQISAYFSEMLRKVNARWQLFMLLQRRREKEEPYLLFDLFVHGTMITSALRVANSCLFSFAVWDFSHIVSKKAATVSFQFHHVSVCH